MKRGFAIAFFLISFALILNIVEGAPDLLSENLISSGILEEGQTTLFQGDVRNQGDGIDTGNSYGSMKKISTGGITSPFKVGVISGGYNVKVIGQYAYVTNQTNDKGLFIIYDISDSTNPSLIGKHSLLSGGRGFDISGNYAYVTSGFGTPYAGYFEIYDISNPAQPLRVGSISIGDPAYDVAVSGNYAYVISDFTGEYGDFPGDFDISNPAAAANPNSDYLEVFDISNPANPTKVGGVNISYLTDIGNHAPLDVEISGNYLYIVISAPEPLIATNIITFSNNTGDTFEIYDISNPVNPVKIGGVRDGRRSSELYLVGNYAYMNIEDVVPANIGVYDISDPTNPRKVGKGTATSNIADIIVSNNNVYTRNSLAGDAFELFELTFQSTARFCIDSVNRAGCFDSTSGTILSEPTTAALAAGAFERLLILPAP